MTTMRNSVQLIGHAGKDPEVKTILNDRKMARFTLATNDFYTNNKGERVEQTQWHRILAWGKTAETIEKEVKKENTSSSAVSSLQTTGKTKMAQNTRPWKSSPSR